MTAVEKFNARLNEEINRLERMKTQMQQPVQQPTTTAQPQPVQQAQPDK